MAANVNWFAPAIISAFIALAGILFGVFVRDVGIATYLRWANREDTLEDKRADKFQVRHDLVRAYADPLLDAVTALFYRLEEIVVKKCGEYLHADAPKVTFHQYKRISTLYRIAALLGWMRAIKRERSCLDPQQVEASDETALLYAIETALADGDHVEMQRVKELTALWEVADIIMKT